MAEIDHLGISFHCYDRVIIAITMLVCKYHVTVILVADIGVLIITLLLPTQRASEPA